MSVSSFDDVENTTPDVEAATEKPSDFGDVVGKSIGECRNHLLREVVLDQPVCWETQINHNYFLGKSKKDFGDALGGGNPMAMITKSIYKVIFLGQLLVKYFEKMISYPIFFFVKFKKVHFAVPISHIGHIGVIYMVSKEHSF